MAGLLAEHPDLLRDGIALRKFGQQAIERLGRERVHPSWPVPGGVNTAARPGGAREDAGGAARGDGDRARTLALWKDTVAGFPEEIEAFSNFPTMYCGLVGPDGSLRLYDGNLRFVGPDGAIVADQVRPEDYATYIGEASPSGLLPQGALLPAHRATRTASIALARSRASTWPTAAARRWRTRSSRSTASGSAGSSRAASTTTTPA